MYYEWKPYVSVAERQRKAAREAARLKKAGIAVSPVVIAGRLIARTFWGKAWCDNLERYSDYANRLPRGRTYVRNGSVMDLQIGSGEVVALVCGSEIYRVEIAITAVPRERWQAICRDCAGAIDSLVELLGGRLSKGVMERLCQPRTGLFPSPAEIELSCSCPDWATMCKHVAAVLYGVGARLDERPELLFKLRCVDERDLVAEAGSGLALAGKGPKAGKRLDEGDLEELFGLELEAAVPQAGTGKPKTPAAAKPKVPAAAKLKVPAASKPKAPAASKQKAPAAGKPKATAPAGPAKAGVRRRASDSRPAAKAPVKVYLDALSGPLGWRWQQVGALIARMNPQAYRDAAGEIAAIAIEAAQAAGEAEVLGVIAALQRIHSNKPGFLRQLDRQGLGSAAEVASP